MTIFTQTLTQTLLLLTFVATGYILAKLNVVGQDSVGVLSKLENWLFMPALVMGTFIEKFTFETISSTWKILLAGFAVEFAVIPLAAAVCRIILKDDEYLRKISAYGLVIPNFGFVGNPVMLALFPEIFFEYLIFTMPFWVVQQLWAVPRYLIPNEAGKKGLRATAKNLVNPMFAGMLIGMIIGLAQIPVPGFLTDAIKVSGDCMSPVAMLLTGITVSAIDLKKTFADMKIYTLSIVRLVAIPLLFAAVLNLCGADRTTFICAVCALAMPLGTNNIIVPSAYGLDTSHAAGMAIISHIMCCITIPLVFMITI
ncbi:MAG: AEC family transporter [Oscillospiraceae bacterium]|nr:AEC family transporter [Oscillospiraceae bacterium]